MLDLENREVLIQYLLEKGVIHSDIPYEVNYCRGGVSCIAALIETEGKTMLVNALAKSASLTFSRIQCTPDMLPSDVTGFTMFDVKTGAKTFHPGPVMSQPVSGG